MEHGFTWFRAVCLVLAILLVFAVRWGIIIVPQVRETANQVASLNQLRTVDLKGKIGGCIPFEVKGNM